MTERSILVPEGLDGQRVDSALSKLLGLSRTAAADICADGGVELDGSPVGKSDRVT
ncbi:RNA pseudouridine synthase, partial [Burkholderia multivorans]